MKNVLIIGGAGTTGRILIKYLLSEGNYVVTVLDVKCKNNYKKLKKYKKRVRIIYSDMNDKSLIDSLVKENTVIIYLAGNLPPLANLNEELLINNEYASIKLITDSIKKYNPQCYFMYGSSTSLYGNVVVNKDSKVSKDINDFYSKYKVKCEKVITKSLKNFTIFRIPYILGDIKKDHLIYNVKLDDEIETISQDNLAFGLVSAIMHKKDLNRKTVNITGGEEYRVIYRDLVLKYIDSYGLTLEMLKVLLFNEKNYISPIVEDDSLNNLLNYRSHSIKYYYNYLDDYKSDIRRVIPRLLGIPVKMILKKKK